MAARAQGNPLAWGLMAFLSVGIAGHGLSFLVLGREHLGAEIAANGFAWPYMIIVHAGAAALALLIGPFQFLGRLRGRFPTVHRWMGRTYVTACLVGGVAGGLIAPYTSAGPVAGAGFLVLAIAWLWCAFAAYRAAVRRDFAARTRRG